MGTRGALAVVFLYILTACHAVLPLEPRPEPDGRPATDASVERVSPDAPGTKSCSAPPGELSVESLAPMELNTGTGEIEPFLTADGLTLYFASRGSDGSHDWDIHRATRPDHDSPFSSPEPVDWANTPDHSETRFAITADGTTVFLATTRPGTGTRGKSDIWIATRPDPSIAFQSTALKPLEIVNTKEDEYDPFPSADGLSLYFVTTSVSGGVGGQDIMVSHRPDTSGSFSAPEPVRGVNSPDDEGNPSLDPDERLIFFDSTRPGGPGNGDIYYATRSSKSAAFSALRPVPIVNTANVEGEVHFAPATCELFFTRSKMGIGWDIYRARITTR